MAGESGLVGEVLGDHGLAEAVGAEQNEVAALLDEVEGQGALDDVALDLLGPVPVEVGDGLEAADAGALEASLEAAPRTFGQLEADDLLDDLARREAALGGAGQEVLECSRPGPEARSGRAAP